MRRVGLGPGLGLTMLMRFLLSLLQRLQLQRPQRHLIGSFRAWKAQAQKTP